MKTLLIPKNVFADIVCAVHEVAHGFETGVTLFGTSLAETPDCQHIVLAIAGPGRKATHEPAHYSGDESHASEIYQTLGNAMPGIRWLGELHVHPRGMTWLSGGDLRTVRQILTGADETLHPDEFIAGVMQRRDGTVDIYPFHFTRAWLAGRAMEIQIVDSDAPAIHQARLKAIEKGNENDRPGICKEPEGSRTAVAETSRHHWLRKWWERHRPHGGKSGDRHTNAR